MTDEHLAWIFGLGPAVGIYLWVWWMILWPDKPKAGERPPGNGPASTHRPDSEGGTPQIRESSRTGGAARTVTRNSPDSKRGRMTRRNWKFRIEIEGDSSYVRPDGKPGDDDDFFVGTDAQAARECERRADLHETLTSVWADRIIYESHGVAHADQA